jgi:hypothetical protein
MSRLKLIFGKIKQWFLYVVIKRFLNYFGYEILLISEGSAMINGNIINWKSTTKVIKKSCCVYVTKTGKIKSKILINEHVDIANIL